MHLSSRPPAADWMGQNSVCQRATLTFPESSTWNHSLLFSGSRQGCHCESVEFLLTPGLLLTPVSMRSPSSSVCPVSSFRGSNATVLQVWRYTLYFTFYYNQQSTINLCLLLCYCQVNSLINTDKKNIPDQYLTIPWYSNGSQWISTSNWEIVCYRRSYAWHKLLKATRNQQT